MRILHTGDWHMNSTLGRQDLSDHIVAALERIAAYLEEYAVDVMLVAGDLFSERSRDEGMKTAISHVNRIFGPFVARGGTIVAIAGNHDSELRFETLREALKLGAGGQNGRFLMTANPQAISLRDKKDHVFQFALLPYPTPRCYLPGATFTSLEEKNRLVQERFATTLEQMRQNTLDPDLPVILVSHLHVRGANSHSLYKISESDDVVFEPSQIPTQWSYAAYGHIHKPGEAVAGMPQIRYCGSVVPLDAAERFDQKSVVLLDMGPQGEREMQILLLPRVPMYKIVFDCTENEPAVEIARWKSELPDAGDALIHYTVKFRPQTHSLITLRQEIEAAFPRWYARDDEKIGVEVAPRPLDLGAVMPDAANPLSGDVPTLVRGYLNARLRDNADRAAVLQLAEELLSAAPKLPSHKS